MECYACGQEGHRRKDCPARFPVPAASDPPGSAEITSQPQPFSALPPFREPTPPLPDYLETRADLGMPTHSAHIQVACPWCKAAPRAQCWNVGTRRHCAPHPSRVELAGDPEYVDLRRELARKQLAEARLDPLHP
jgi:zinc knuckle protein